MAEVWDWAIGYLLVFAALQLAVYIYYRRQTDSGPSRAVPEGDGIGFEERAASAPATRRREPTGDSRHCPHCGTPNELDPTFRYCRYCAGDLSGT
ncbi:hypothetical protein [Haloarchaeobius sp. HME9146]|uniref:DUF7577 domain-containing protein n=1 Tax=Haloarchaeobius sp. HME9146 TaxID=2978732 RepID=UPI0021BFAE7F|nr:hypothetical protein [Haloarchaeobius sp. HME9146]MCT9094447.1 hypothetical protein [Haloarchaeobius sp. HME9146]